MYSHYILYYIIERLKVSYAALTKIDRTGHIITHRIHILRAQRHTLILIKPPHQGRVILKKIQQPKSIIDRR